MIHPNTELKLINNQIGYGVIAKEFIPAGTITWVLDAFDREFTPKKVAKMKSVYKTTIDTYCYRNHKGNFILCWDHGRYVNHSFKSNCLSTAYDFEIAIRDIFPGEELTDDYGYLNVLEPFTGIEEGTERKTVYPDDLLHFHQIWDQQILNVFYKIPEVNQPLKELISTKTWQEVLEIVQGSKQMLSILHNHYAEEKTKKNPTKM